MDKQPDLTDETLTHDSYKYDIFVSYPHEEQHIAWVEHIFIDPFEFYMTQTLGRKPSIFWDRRNLKTGENWDEKLKVSLAYSKVMIAVCSVHYFLSKYCKKECSMMLHREKSLGYGTKDKPGGLILPLKVWDGEQYPEIILKKELKEFRKYGLTGDGYKDTNDFDKFKKDLESWAPMVRDAILSAGRHWRKEWIEDKWLKEAASRFAEDLDPVEAKYQNTVT